jgi:hypothetical protein
MRARGSLLQHTADLPESHPMSLVTFYVGFRTSTKANCHTNKRLSCNKSCHAIVTRSDNLLV